jgi:transposase, IS5 family
MEPPPSPDCDDQGEMRMERTRLANLLNERHPLVKLAQQIDWRSFDEHFGMYYSEGTGRPATSTRLMVSLHYLKYTHDLSDEAVLRGWVENPYWQYLSGMEFFCHEPPVNPSSMSRWRSRVGEAGGEELLRQTIEAGLRMGVIKPSELKRVNVDTTVQEKHIRFPTDPRLYDRMRERLVMAARREGVALRQSYVRVGKRLLAQQSRYAHAKQWRRARLYARAGSGPSWAGSSATSSANCPIRARRRGICSPSPGGSTSKSAMTKASSTASMPRRWNASRRARLINATSLAAKSPSR